MITFPAIILLALFAVIFIIFVLIILAQLYHGYRFGRHDPLTMTVNAFFSGSVIAIVIATIILLSPIDWSQTFSITIPTVSSNALPNAVNQVESIVPLQQ